MKKLHFLSFSAVMLVFIVQVWGQSETYTNPVGNISGIGDPFVLKDNGLYYMYCTSAPDVGFKVWTSENLVDWKEKGLAFNNNFPGNGWGTGDFWAPEVIYYDSVYYMVYSTRAPDGKLKICLAKSNHPLGPFVNVKTPWLDENLVCIDGHIFLDQDGTPYLFFAKDCSENIVNGKHVSQIYVQRLTPHTLEPVGEPQFCIQPSQPWEHPNDEWQWNEGPFVLKHNGYYYLMFSANYFASQDYAIGYATARTPFGPWTKFSGNPILQKDLSIGVSGPGHNSVTTSPDDTEMFIVYHTHTDPQHPSGDRQPNIDRLFFRNDSLIVIGPTRSPQPMPSANNTSILDDAQGQILQSPVLFQNYPNPFNNQTQIRYRLPQTARVFLAVYDLTGRRLATLANKVQTAGYHRVLFNGQNRASGFYFYGLTVNQQTRFKKMLLIR